MGGLDRVFRGRRAGSQMRPLAAIIAGLWKNGEQGVWYDPTDLSTMYQDASGVLPVYMPGQGQVDPPVGLLLDKRLGLSVGDEALTNADFSAGSAGWMVANADASHIVTFADGRVRYQSDTTSPVLSLQQTNKMIVGGWYELTGVVSSWVSGSLKCDGLSGVGAIPEFASGAGPFRVIGRAVSANFDIKRNTVNVDVTLESVSLRPLRGNHAYQTTTTSRPALSARYNLLTYSERFDASAWAKVQCSVVPAASVGPNGGNVYKLIPSTETAQHAMTCSAGSAAESRTALVVAKADGCQKITLWPGGSGSFAHFDLVTGIVSREPNVLSSSMTPLGDGWYELRATWAVQTLAVLRIYTSLGSLGSANTPGDGVSGILLERADLRTANDGVGLPPYQRVGDANTYDTVGFPLCLRFDGVDDFLQTANIDFSAASSITAFAAVRKLSDATRGIIFELGSLGYGQPGSFNFEQAWFSPNFSASHSGASGSATTTKAGIGAPASAVLSAVFDQSAPVVRLRYQGQDASQNAGVVGGGGYLNAPIYIGRRAGTSSPASMRLYGAAIRTGVLGGMQIAAVEKLLNQKARIY